MKSSPLSRPRQQMLPTAIQQILVPIDFSAASEQAFMYAQDLAEHLHAEVTLAHVVSPGHRGNPNEEMETFLLEHDTGQTLKGLIEVGEAAPTLVQMTETLGIDLVVMGTQGAASHSQKPMGSVAASMIAQTDCPVLAIPAETTYQPIQQMVYALSLRSERERTIDFLIDFGKQLNASLTCAHINTEHNQWDDLEVQQLKQAYQGDREIPLSFLRAEDEAVVHGLQQILSQERADLLVMSTRDRNLWERFFDPSLTRTMLLYTDLPILALHA